MPQITREQFLKLLAAGGASFLGLSSAVADTASSKGPVVPWGRLKFTAENGDQEDWHVHPNGDLNLIDSVRDQTSINLEKKWNVADITDLKTMTPYPFLFMHAELAPVLSDSDRQNLREYLLRGGFLFAEDCVNGYGHHGNTKTNHFFFDTMKKELPALLPSSRFEKLSNNHPIFHCFYSLNGLPLIQGIGLIDPEEHAMWGLTHEGRLVSVLSPTDLHCGWTNGPGWFTKEQNIASVQMGTNIYLYAMTQASGMTQPS
jgi:hypothetical protein